MLQSVVSHQIFVLLIERPLEGDTFAGNLHAFSKQDFLSSLNEHPIDVLHHVESPHQFDKADHSLPIASFNFRFGRFDRAHTSDQVPPVQLEIL